MKISKATPENLGIYFEFVIEIKVMYYLLSSNLKFVLFICVI